MLIRAIVAFLAMQGVVDFGLPAYMATHRTPPIGWHFLGVLPLELGSLGLVWDCRCAALAPVPSTLCVSPAGKVL